MNEKIHNKIFKKKSFLKGMTLIELLIVISIIALLSSAILMRINQSRQSAKDVKNVSATKTLADALDQYFQENNGTVPCDPVVTNSWYFSDLDPKWDAELLPKLSPYLNKYGNPKEGKILYGCSNNVGPVYWNNIYGCFVVRWPGYFLQIQIHNSNPNLNKHSIIPTYYWQPQGMVGEYITISRNYSFTTSGPCPPT
jgi:prepilin-type N-terminal cleavage/methylation domain-containing protein